MALRPLRSGMSPKVASKAWRPTSGPLGSRVRPPSKTPSASATRNRVRQPKGDFTPLGGCLFARVCGASAQSTKQAAVRSREGRFGRMVLATVVAAVWRPPPHRLRRKG